MGNSASQAPKKLTQEQQDLKSLAERFAFGDDELRHLYQAYQILNNKSRSERKSFIQDWGLACFAEEEENARADRHARLLQVDSILGDFGNRLYDKVFLAAGDASIYDEEQKSEPNAATVESTTPVIVDEYTRKSRLEAVFDGLARCSRRGSQATLTALFQTLANEQEQVGSLELVTVSYNLALATVILQQELDAVPPAHAATLQALANSLTERALAHRQRYGFSGAEIASLPPAGHVELTELLEWADTACPVFSAILPSFLWQIFSPNRPYPPSRTAFEFPRLLLSTESSKNSSSDDNDNNNDEAEDDYYNNHLLSPTARFVLACWSSSLNGPFFPLYNSEQDGLSFNRLQNALLGYDGPTLMVIKQNTNMFGAFTASKWKEAKDFYGTSETFLWTLSPRIVRVYRPTLQEKPHYQYCNSSARSKGYDQQAHGLGFGGTCQRPRLFLSETLDACHADRQDLTFDNGPLLVFAQEYETTSTPPTNGNTTSSFSPDSLQVWGVGGEAVVQTALQARGLHRQVVEQGIQRARKVDKAQFLDDFRTGAISSKAFAFRQQIDGRADQDVDERYNQQRKNQQSSRY